MLPQSERLFRDGLERLEALYGEGLARVRATGHLCKAAPDQIRQALADIEADIREELEGQPLPDPIFTAP